MRSVKVFMSTEVMFKSRMIITKELSVCNYHVIVHVLALACESHGMAYAAVPPPHA